MNEMDVNPAPLWFFTCEGSRSRSFDYNYVARHRLHCYSTFYMDGWQARAAIVFNCVMNSKTSSSFKIIFIQIMGVFLWSHVNCTIAVLLLYFYSIEQQYIAKNCVLYQRAHICVCVCVSVSVSVCDGSVYLSCDSCRTEVHCLQTHYSKYAH